MSSSLEALNPLRVHFSDTLSTIIRNMLVRVAEESFRTLKEAIRRGDLVNVPATAYGCSLAGWANIWVEVLPLIEKWSAKVDDSGVHVCVNCLVNTVESASRDIFVMQFMQSIDDIESDKASATLVLDAKKLYDIIYHMLDPENFDHED